MSTVNNQLSIFKASPIVHEAAIRLNQIEWGKSMSLSDYIRREYTLLQSRAGQLTHASWVLMSTQNAQLWSSSDIDHVSNIMTQRNLTYSDIPILAACETYTRTAQLFIPNDNDDDQIIHDIPLISIASVFVQPKLRGNNYASILLTKLYQTQLDHYSTTNKWIASVLYSDIGPNFYNKLGWQTYPSYSLVFKNKNTKNTIIKPNDTNIKWMNQSDIPSLLKTIPCPPVINTTDTTTNNKYQLRLPIHYDIIDHFIRRSHHYYTLPIFKHQLDMPYHYGVCLDDNTGCIIWNHLPEPNTLYILHYQATTMNALHTLLQAAQYEAQEWGLNKIEAYLSSEQHDFITQQSLPNDWEIIERKDSLSSIRISHNQQDIKDVPNTLIWIGNERYGWV